LGPGFAYFDLIVLLISDHGIPGRAFKIKAEVEKEKVKYSRKCLHNYLLSDLKSRNRI